MERAQGQSSRSVVRAAVERIRRAARAILLLDYDGTLVTFVDRPERARPDRALLALLGDLAAAPGREVHVLSGRRREDLEAWLGALPVGLHAEHGYWSREPGGTWAAAGPLPEGWRAPVRALLDEYAARTPGTHVEEKTIGLAWHHRAAADPVHGAAQARALERRLAAILAGGPAEIVAGDMVIEVRLRGIDKGLVVRRLAAATPDALVVALGDDRTDEDMFAALPEGGLAVHVGPRPSVAALRLRGVTEARAFLRALA